MNLLNPKVVIFYVSFLPQFIPVDVSVAPYAALLDVILAAMGLAWFICLTVATRHLVRWLARAAVMRALDRMPGGIFVAFGVGLALHQHIRRGSRFTRSF